MKIALNKLTIFVIMILSQVFVFGGYLANLNKPSISISLDQDNGQVGILERAAIRLHLELCEIGILRGREEPHVGYLERLRIRVRLDLCNNGIVGACQVICTSNLPQNCACFNPYWNKNVSCINGIDQDERPCIGCCCNNEEINCTTPPSLTLTLSYGGAWGGVGANVSATANDPDGTNVAITCSNPNFSCTNGCANPLPEGTGTTACTAVDGNGESRNRTVSWQTDYTAPNISISVAGPPGVTITILVGCSDTLSGCDAVTYQISIDGGGWTSPGIFTLTGGTHTIQARGSDHAGNIGSTSTTINLDSAPPVVSINKPQGCSGTLTITGTATDNVNIASVTLNVDGTNNSVTPDSSGNWSYTQAYKEGNHNASVTAADLGGNSASASVSFGVDNTAPSVSLPSSWTSNEHGTLGVIGDVSKVKITLSTNTGETSSKTYSSNNYPTKIILETYLPNFIFRETSGVTVKAIAVDSCGNSDTASGKITYYFPPSTATPLPTPESTNTSTPSEKRNPKPTNTEKTKEIMPIHGFVNELGNTSITVDEKRYTLNANSHIDESLGELKSGVKVVGYAYSEGFIVIELQVLSEDGIFCGEIRNITDSNENGEYFIMIDSLSYSITPETVINENDGKMKFGALVEGAVWDQEVIQLIVVRNCENLFSLFKGTVTRIASENSNSSRNMRVEGILYQLTPTTKIVSDDGVIQWGDKVEGIYLTIDGTVISVRVLERGFDWRILIIVVLVFLMILLAFLVGIPFDGYLLEVQTQHIKLVKDEKEFEIVFSDSQRKLVEGLRGQDVEGRKVPIFNKLITIK